MDDCKPVEILEGFDSLSRESAICMSCHLRHNFSAEQAREPEACGRCHLGPDHPQKEIYEESAHGIAYRAHKDKMNPGSSKWVVGEDYSAAPTCATCFTAAWSDGGCAGASASASSR